MADFSLKPIILVFVAVIIAVIFLGEIADNEIDNTQLSGINNENITIVVTTADIINESVATFTSGQGVVVNAGLVNLSFFGNATNNTFDTTVSVGTEVNFSRSGIITISQFHFASNGPYNVSYRYIKTATASAAQGDIVTVSLFRNATIGLSTTGIDLNEEINVTKAGAISLAPANFSAGDYNMSYEYEGALYVVDKKSHPFLKLNSLFFAVMIIAMVIGGLMIISDKFNFGFKE